MDFYSKKKKSAVLYMAAVIAYFVLLFVLRPCRTDEAIMRCYWYCTALKCAALPLFVNGIVSLRCKEIETGMHSAVLGLCLAVMVLMLTYGIGVCPSEEMECNALKWMAWGMSVLLAGINVTQLLVISQIKKYTLEAKYVSADFSKSQET